MLERYSWERKAGTGQPEKTAGMVQKDKKERPTQNITGG
jgi:hypothetical protein